MAKKQNSSEILKIDCKACVKRSTCTHLCPAAEAYANQDWVIGSREVTFQHPSAISRTRVDGANDEDGERIARTVSDKNSAILLLASGGFSRTKIAKILGLSKQNVSNRICYMRKKIHTE